MKVTDKRTGNVIESENKFITDMWRENPERFVSVGERAAPGRTTADDKQQKPTEK